MTTYGATSSMRTVRIAGADDLDLVADTWGKAPWDVVLLHGGGQTRQAWGRTPSRMFELGLSVLNIDLRGHGESAWDPAGRYAYLDHARDLVAHLSDEHPSILIGASLGGVTSLGAALHAPERIRAVVLVDIAPTMQYAGVGKIVAFMRANPDGFATLDDAREAVSAYQPHRRGRTGAGLERNLRRSPTTGRWVWHWDPRTLDFAREAWYQRQTSDMSTAVRNLTVPVILVRGEHSDVILPSDVDSFMALGTHTRTVVVPNARHMVAGDENDVFMTQILRELQEQVSGFPRVAQ